jgi:CheY-like chemotaxis protein
MEVEQLRLAQPPLLSCVGRGLANGFARGTDGAHIRAVQYWTEAMRCLIVDDNQAFAENLAEILEDLGEETFVANDGRSAIAELERGPFHLLLCDFRMPEMNGADVIREAKRIQPELRAVIVSAFANDAELAEATTMGAMALLPKPIPISALKDLLSRAP